MVSKAQHEVLSADYAFVIPMHLAPFTSHDFQQLWLSLLHLPSGSSGFEGSALVVLAVRCIASVGMHDIFLSGGLALWSRSSCD